MLKEFKEFAIKGNMIDMAVGIIIGGAFHSLVSTLVNDVIMPLLSVLTGKIDFSNIFFAMDGKHYDTLSAVPEGVATVNIGVFISGVINFIIMAFVVFMIVKMINKIREPKGKPAPAAPTTKKCPYCRSEIAIEATRCPHCTSVLDVIGEEQPKM